MPPVEDFDITISFHCVNKRTSFQPSSLLWNLVGYGLLLKLTIDYLDGLNTGSED